MTMYVLGDPHGHYDAVAGLLRGAGLVNHRLRWTGGDAVLWVAGDFFDRGPFGIDCLDLIIRLQREAESVGGLVDSVIGNHDILLLAAQRFGGLFTGLWRRNGGRLPDLDRLTEQHRQWLITRPAMVRVGDAIILHGDTTLYEDYGDTLEAVNRAFADLLAGDDMGAWYDLLDAFSEHQAFYDNPEAAARFRQRYGGDVLIHGHTPIMKITRQIPREVTEALVYDDGRCINVDGGIYRGGPGFVYHTTPPAHPQ